MSDRLVTSAFSNNDVILEQVIWSKMMSPQGKLTALACHQTNKVNKVYLFTNRPLGVRSTGMRVKSKQGAQST